jgi:hypothetical protein
MPSGLVSERTSSDWARSFSALMAALAFSLLLDAVSGAKLFADQARTWVT